MRQNLGKCVHSFYFTSSPLVSGCQLQLGFEVANSLPRPNLRNASTAVIPALAAGGTGCQMVSFGLTNPTQVAMPCNFLVSVNGESIKIPLKISDLVRPSAISTNDFGANWGKMAAASSAVTVNVGSAAVPRFVETVTKKLRLHHIQTIGLEIIAAGNLSSVTNANMLLPILVHCKCTPNASYGVIVRTPNPPISKAIARELQQLLSM